MSDVVAKGLIESGEVDFGRKSDDYAEHRPGFPDSFYERVFALVEKHRASAGLDARGLRVLDLGTGPGILALRVAQLFGEGSTGGSKRTATLGVASIVGADIAEPQIVAARKRAEAFGFAPATAAAPAAAAVTAASAVAGGTSERCTVDFLVSRAESLPSLATGTFDVVLAGQCWPWFDAPLVMAEIRRLLKPRVGVFAIGQYCYLPKRSALASATEALVLKFNPTWRMMNGDGLYPTQVDQVVCNGRFAFLEQFSYDVRQPFNAVSWRGRMRTCNGLGSGTLTPEQLAQFDRELSDMCADPARWNGEFEGGNVWHRVWAVVVSEDEIATEVAPAAASAAAASTGHL